jgi:hypothetical protein
MPPSWLTYVGEKGGELWANHMGFKKWCYLEHNEEHITDSRSTHLDRTSELLRTTT